MHQASPQVLKEGAHLAGVPTPRMSLKFTAPGVNKTCLALNELMLLVSQSQNYPHFKSKCTQAFSHSIFYPCGRGMSQNGQRTGVRLLATWKSGAGRHSPGLDLPLSLALLNFRGSKGGRAQIEFVFSKTHLPFPVPTHIVLSFLEES